MDFWLFYTEFFLYAKIEKDTEQFSLALDFLRIKITPSSALTAPLEE